MQTNHVVTRLAAMLVALALLSFLCFGCAQERAEEHHRQAQDQLARVEQAIGTVEQARQEAEHAAARLDELEGLVSEAALQQARQEQAGKLEALRADLQRLETVREAAAEVVDQTERAIEAGRQTDQNLLGLGDAAAGALAVAVPSAGALATALWGIIKTGRRKRLEGEAIGVEMVRDSVDALRNASPELDRAFRELDDKHRRLAGLAFKGAEHLRKLVQK